MATKQIELDNGLLEKAEVPADQAEPISGAIGRVNATLDHIGSPLIRVC